MTRIFPGRYTASLQHDFVVFLIGMRINRFASVHKWLPVAMAMPPMIRALETDPQKGYLGAESFISARTSCMVTYWKSFEDLERFSKNPSDLHLESWKKFNRRVGADGSVGIWHETYQVRAGEYEVLYGNMPRFGLARAGRHLPAAGPRRSARARLGASGRRSNRDHWPGQHAQAPPVATENADQAYLPLNPRDIASRPADNPGSQEIRRETL